LQGTSLKRI